MTKDFSYCLIIETKQTPKITFQNSLQEHCLRGAIVVAAAQGRGCIDKEPALSCIKVENIEIEI